MGKKTDPLANEFGTHDWFSEVADEANKLKARQLAFGEIERRLNVGDLAPLNGRARIENDWLAPDPEFFGNTQSSHPLTEPERQTLRAEYQQEVDRVLSGGTPAPSQQRGEEQAEQMLREFAAKYPALARDPDRLEQAARIVVEQGGYDPSDRPAFYARVASEMKNVPR